MNAELSKVIDPISLMVKFGNVRRCKKGNFGITTAVCLPVLLGAAGLSIDLYDAYQTRAHLSGIADSAALAATSALGEKKITTIAQAKALAESFVQGQLAVAGLDPADFKTSIDIKSTAVNAVSNKFDVTVAVLGGIETTIMRIFGRPTIDIAQSATATSSTASQTSLSMYLVLDRSGSMQVSVTTSVKSQSACTYYYMNAQQNGVNSEKNRKPCYYQRIEVLQNAVAGLLDTMAKADPEKKFIRIGADAYNDKAFDPEDLEWGTKTVEQYVNAMTPAGGTNSTGAFTEGVNSLLDPMEESIHKNKNGLVPKKFIILMTDGENTNISDNTKTLAQCKRAKDAGVTVYTVGFMLSAATAKTFLLNCASSSANYFDAQDGALLTAAFKSIASQTSGAVSRLIN